VPLPVIPDDKLLISEPAFLYAGWVNETDLAVYQCPLVTDTDPLYEPVKSLLNSNKHRILCAEIHEDEDMMFGRANLTVYRIKQ
jgi:hypothetical protein